MFLVEIIAGNNRTKSYLEAKERPQNLKKSSPARNRHVLCGLIYMKLAG